MEEKFTELLFQNQGIINKICNIYFNDRIHKEDYHQELIIQLWKAFPSFNYKSKFSTWMYRVCLNAAIDILRKEKSLPSHVQFEIHEHNTLSDSPKEINENHEKLFKAINRLSQIDKAIITLYLEDLSYKEISEIIGISITNTGVKINRIKTQISKYIDNGNKRI